NHMSSSDLTLPSHGVTNGFWLFTTTIVFGFAAATALMRFTFAGESWRPAEIVVAVPSGFGVVLLASLSLTKTIALLFPAAAAAASAMSPAARVYASRMLAGPHGARTAATAGLPPAAAAAGVETQLVASFTVSEMG